MKMKTAMLILCVALSSCAKMQYGDGKVGAVSIDPAVEWAANLADAKVPGSGAKIRAYAGGAKAERVPPGYAIEWESFLDGAKIDRAKIVDVPRLIPANPAAPAVIVTTNVPSAAPSSPPSPPGDNPQRGGGTSSNTVPATPLPLPTN